MTSDKVKSQTAKLTKIPRDLSKPKGRIVTIEAKQRVKAVIGSPPYARDLLIEYLHQIQDSYGYLAAQNLAALASLMKLSQVEVYETASFYHHFDIVKDHEQPPPAITIRVCDSLPCMMAGCERLIHELHQKVSPNQIRVVRASCLGLCDKAPAAIIAQKADRKLITDANVAKIIAATPLTSACDLPDYTDLTGYLATGGYRLLKSCLNGDYPLEQLIGDLSHADLRGLGGAGFPAGKKWSIVRSFGAERLMTINADEGEPGTFKDRHCLASDPHRVLEGGLIAAWAVEAKRCYFYIRDEYPDIRAILHQEIAKINEAKLTDHCPIELRRGAGAYICGEESAMLESIEGKRGLPRNRPPYIAQQGLFGQPTLNHNVETLYWIRDIIEKSPQWFISKGVNGAKGLCSYSISGRVKHPGVKMAPAGASARQLIDDYCGGMAEGHDFIGYLPGGASGGILPASMANIPLDFGQLEKYGCFIGSHAIVILSDQDDLRTIALNLLKFFYRESCGQCTPCRLGTKKMLELLQEPVWDEDLITDLEQVMHDASICGLGQAAANPVRSILNYFRQSL